MKIEMQRFGKTFEQGKDKQKRNNALLGVIVFLIISIVVVALMSIGVETAIRYCVVLGQEETWVASVA